MSNECESSVAAALGPRLPLPWEEFGIVLSADGQLPGRREVMGGL